MGTAIPTSPKRGPRVRESVRDGEIGRDAQYDLLTAALIGAAIGATATLLLRRGPSGSRPVTPVLRGAKWAGRGAMAASAAGARWAREHGGGIGRRTGTLAVLEHAPRARVDSGLTSPAV